jgi:hypothetical protein
MDLLMGWIEVVWEGKGRVNRGLDLKHEHLMTTSTFTKKGD